MIEALIFYVFAFILTISAVTVVSTRNPVHAVLFLILAFFNAAALFILMGAEFLAMLLVIVYVGAVAVLFLFVVMMLNVSMETFRDGLTKYSRPGAYLAAIMLFELGLLFRVGGDAATIEKAQEPIPEGINNTEALGNIIYTDYIFLFQVSGLILLVAMIGAIVLTFEKRTKMRKQVINDQVARDPKKAIKLVKVESGKGVN